MKQPVQARTARHRPAVPRFGLASLLLVMLVISIICAEGYYLVRAIRGNRSEQFPFILFTLVAPVLVATLVSIGRVLVRMLQHRQN